MENNVIEKARTQLQFTIHNIVSSSIYMKHQAVYNNVSN
jgi:hypothetical protein